MSFVFYTLFSKKLQMSMQANLKNQIFNSKCGNVPQEFQLKNFLIEIYRIVYKCLKVQEPIINIETNNPLIIDDNKLDDYNISHYVKIPYSPSKSKLINLEFIMKDNKLSEKDYNNLVTDIYNAYADVQMKYFSFIKNITIDPNYRRWDSSFILFQNLLFGYIDISYLENIINDGYKFIYNFTYKQINPKDITPDKFKQLCSYIFQTYHDKSKNVPYFDIRYFDNLNKHGERYQITYQFTDKQKNNSIEKMITFSIKEDDIQKNTMFLSFISNFLNIFNKYRLKYLEDKTEIYVSTKDILSSDAIPLIYKIRSSNGIKRYEDDGKSPLKSTFRDLNEIAKPIQYASFSLFSNIFENTIGKNNIPENEKIYNQVNDNKALFVNAYNIALQRFKNYYLCYFIRYYIDLAINLQYINYIYSQKKCSTSSAERKMETIKWEVERKIAENKKSFIEIETEFNPINENISTIEICGKYINLINYILKQSSSLSDYIESFDEYVIDTERKRYAEQLYYFKKIRESDPKNVQPIFDEYFKRDKFNLFSQDKSINKIGNKELNEINRSILYVVNNNSNSFYIGLKEDIISTIEKNEKYFTLYDIKSKDIYDNNFIVCASLIEYLTLILGNTFIGKNEIKKLFKNIYYIENNSLYISKIYNDENNLNILKKLSSEYFEENSSSDRKYMLIWEKNGTVEINEYLLSSKVFLTEYFGQSSNHDFVINSYNLRYNTMIKKMISIVKSMMLNVYKDIFNFSDNTNHIKYELYKSIDNTIGFIYSNTLNDYNKVNYVTVYNYGYPNIIQTSPLEEDGTYLDEGLVYKIIMSVIEFISTILFTAINYPDIVNKTKYEIYISKIFRSPEFLKMLFIPTSITHFKTLYEIDTFINQIFEYYNLNTRIDLTEYLDITAYKRDLIQPIKYEKIIESIYSKLSNINNFEEVYDLYKDFKDNVDDIGSGKIGNILNIISKKSSDNISEEFNESDINIINDSIYKICCNYSLISRRIKINYLIKPDISKEFNQEQINFIKSANKKIFVVNKEYMENIINENKFYISNDELQILSDELNQTLNKIVKKNNFNNYVLTLFANYNPNFNSSLLSSGKNTIIVSDIIKFFNLMRESDPGISSSSFGFIKNISTDSTENYYSNKIIGNETITTYCDMTDSIIAKLFHIKFYIPNKYRNEFSFADNLINSIFSMNENPRFTKLFDNIKLFNNLPIQILNEITDKFIENTKIEKNFGKCLYLKIFFILSLFYIFTEYKYENGENNISNIIENDKYLNKEWYEGIIIDGSYIINNYKNEIKDEIYNVIKSTNKKINFNSLRSISISYFMPIILPIIQSMEYEIHKGYKDTTKKLKNISFIYCQNSTGDLLQLRYNYNNFNELLFDPVNMFYNRFVNVKNIVDIRDKNLVLFIDKYGDIIRKSLINYNNNGKLINYLLTFLLTSTVGDETFIKNLIISEYYNGRKNSMIDFSNKYSTINIKYIEKELDEFTHEYEEMKKINEKVLKTVDKLIIFIIFNSLSTKRYIYNSTSKFNSFMNFVNNYLILINSEDNKSRLTQITEFKLNKNNLSIIKSPSNHINIEYNDFSPIVHIILDDKLSISEKIKGNNYMKNFYEEDGKIKYEKDIYRKYIISLSKPSRTGVMNSLLNQLNEDMDF